MHKWISADSILHQNVIKDLLFYRRTVEIVLAISWGLRNLDLCRRRLGCVLCHELLQAEGSHVHPDLFYTDYHAISPEYVSETSLEGSTRKAGLSSFVVWASTMLYLVKSPCIRTLSMCSKQALLVPFIPSSSQPEKAK